MKIIFVLLFSLVAFSSSLLASQDPASCELKLRAQASRIAEHIAQDINLVSYVTSFQDILAVTLSRGMNTFQTWKITKLKLDENNHYSDARRIRQAGPQSEFSNGITIGAGESLVLERATERVFLNSTKLNDRVESAEIIWIEASNTRRPVRHYLTISSDFIGTGVYAAGSGARSVEALVAFMEYTRHFNHKDVSALIQKWAELENNN